MKQDNIFKPSLWKYKWHFFMALPSMGITAIIALLKYHYECLIIDGDVIISKSGIINKMSKSTKINNQITVDVRQGVWGKVFDYGDIIIKTPTTIYKFKYMKNPNKIVDLIISKQ